MSAAGPTQPWRGLFYPAELPAKRELEYASGRLTAIEVNGTFYRSQGPKSFAKWRDETPEDFVFTVKGHRAVVNAKKLGEAGGAVEWFFKSGVTELKDKLGPVLWQLAPFKKFDPEDLSAFLALLPREVDGMRAPPRGRGAEQDRSSCRSSSTSRAKHDVAIVYADSDDYPAIVDVTADFVYARLQRSAAERRRDIPRPTSINGRSARRLGGGRRARRPTEGRPGHRRRRRSATSSSSSSAAPRSAIPPRRKR